LAIEGMKRVTLLVPSDRCEDAVGVLQKMGAMHFSELPEEWTSDDVLNPIERSAQHAEEQIRRVEVIEALFHELDPLKRGFMESLVNVPMVVPQEEFHGAAARLDLEALSAECQGISDAHHEAQREFGQVEAEIAVLGFFRDLPFDVAAIHNLHRVHVWIGSLNARRWQDLQEDAWAAERMAFQVVASDKRTVTVCAVAMEGDREEAAALLKRCELAERPLPSLEALQPTRIPELRARLDVLAEQCNGHRARVRELTAAHRRQVAVAGEFWRGELARVQTLSSGAASRRVSVFVGYVRARAAERFERKLAERLPEASVTFADPRPEEEVPVSLRLNGLLRPMKFLVRMFGLPDYFSFDPTPYLSFSFLLFFGVCFGDVVYGLMLCGVAGYLAWKARRFGGLYELSMLFFYAGITTIIVGALTGSWAGDLYNYLGKDAEGVPNNFLWHLKNKFALIDPLQKPVFMLLVALGIGICNQLYGIVLKGYGLLRRGDAAGAVFDAGLWLLVLPGFLVLAGKLFFPMPGWLFAAGAAVFGVGAIGLILTQGRAEPTFAGKAITGVVSLYGILGSYGCVAFIGDMLSYSRLLALGLTTSIVAMSFNIMAGLLRGVPAVGIVLFVGALVFGHVFNFAISILGAFVHSARLIFLEFFSRFYQAGGVPFRPLSVSTERVLVTSSEAEAA
jgi:V/A-type H+-transporting ATPase subunit I